MSANWYYVENNDRVGPISNEELKGLINNGTLNEQSYVWTKGFDNWKRVSEVQELQIIQEAQSIVFDWETVANSERIFMIRVGVDRGSVESEYGPFSLDMLKKLYDENRINGKTLLYTKGLDNWTYLADVPIYEMLFEEVPPTIEDSERRANIRKPFVARMFFHDNSAVFEGVCRDISVGGLQVLVSGAPVRIGEEISLNVHPDNSDYHFVARGKVARLLDGDQGFSLRFNGLSEEAYNAINSYVES